MLTKSKHWYSIKKMIPKGAYRHLLSGYYNMRSIFHRGNNVHCPICEQDFQKFIEGHACPSCGSGKRHRLLYLFLKNETNFFTEKLHVLHFAPEYCFHKRFSELPNVSYLSADLDSPRAMVKVDMMNIQYPDNEFDVVISSHVLEHVPDDGKAMLELCRVMKKSGWGIHQAPVNYTREKTFEDNRIVTNADRLKYYGHIDHKRLYGRDYTKRLEDAGFLVNEVHYTDQFTDNDIDRFGLDKGEIIYYVRKK